MPYNNHRRIPHKSNTTTLYKYKNRHLYLQQAYLQHINTLYINKQPIYNVTMLVIERKRDKVERC